MPKREIDFLPIQYREQHDLRRQVIQRILIGLVVAGLLAGLAAWQSHSGRAASRELAQLLPQYEQAVRQNRELSKLHDELRVAQAEAELITYLRHPWPRTQLLRALAEPLPKMITLSEVTIARDANRSAQIPDRSAQLDRQAQEQQLAKLAPAARDLKMLRDQFDRAQVVISLSGTTTDGQATHQYVQKLEKNGLFKDAKLVSQENSATDREGKFEFKAVVSVRPGYGLPDGPTAPPASAVTQRQPAAAQGGLP